MDQGLFRDIIGDEELPHGVEPLLLALEEGGWKPRTRMGRSGLRYWPDGERRRQIVIEIGHPVNEYKLDFYREHTGLALTIEITEREVGADE